MIHCGTQHHFVGKCAFHHATFIGSLLVSTVGEYYDSIKHEKMERLTGADNSFFETMVFRTDGKYDGKYKHPTVTDWLGRTLRFYDTPAKANHGHARAVALIAARGVK